MALYERDGEGKLIKAEDVPEETIRVMESMDDIAIIHRMTTGIAGDAFIYRYPIQTKTGVKEIIGISTDGAYELAGMSRNLETLPDFKIDKDSDPDYIYAVIRVKNIATNVTLLGVGRQCKFMVDKGNNPIRDRINEHAFVSGISKAQRNGILHHIKQEVLVEIINTWSKTGKSRQLRPPPLVVEETPPAPTAVVAPPTPPTTPTAQQIAEQQERLKKLRMEVHNKFQTELGISVEQRRKILMDKFGVNSLTDLSEQQLKECKVLVEDMIAQRTIAPPVVKPPSEAESKTKRAGELGFENLEEQSRLRGRLYTVLTSPDQLSLKNEEAKKFVTDRGFASTSDISKDRLLEMIKDAGELVRIKQAPPEESAPQIEDIPF